MAFVNGVLPAAASQGLAVRIRLTVMFALLFASIAGIAAIAWQVVDLEAKVAGEVYQLSRATGIHQDADRIYGSLGASICEQLLRDVDDSGREAMPNELRSEVIRRCSALVGLADFPLESELDNVVTSSGRPEASRNGATAIAAVPAPADPLPVSPDFDRMLAAMSGQAMLLSTEVFMTARRLESTAEAAKSWILTAGLLAMVCAALLASLVIRST